MPELPEVEIMKRRLTDSLKGAIIDGVRLRGLSTLKTFDPPLETIVGAEVIELFRRGKHLAIALGGDAVLLVHLMSAGRLQVFESPASPRDKTLRVGLQLNDGRELRLREFGTHQAAWLKLLAATSWPSDPAVATLGPEAWPDPPPFDGLLDQPRPLHSLLRDQSVIAGIGRSWVDEILHAAQLSPYKRANDLGPEEAERLRDVTVQTLESAIAHYEQTVGATIPDKLPMPLTVHGRAGAECPRCGGTIEAVHFESYVIAYCPRCQTNGKKLKDRRTSRFLK